MQSQVASQEGGKGRFDMEGRGGNVTTETEIDVATNLGMLAATRSRKRQEINSSLEPPKGVWVQQS